MWKTVFKVTISCLILGVLFYEVHFDQLKPYFQKISLTWFMLALFMQFLSTLIAAWRWSLIMDTLKFQVPLKFYLKSYLKGVMFNQVLPTSVGGDAYRIIETSRLGRGKKEAALGVLVDRIYGLVGLVLVSLFSLPFAYYLLPQSIFKGILIVNVVAILGVGLLLGVRYLSIPFLRSIFNLLNDLAKRMMGSVNSSSDFLIKALLTLLPCFLTSYSFFLLAHALGVAGSLMDYLVIIPSVILLTMIPISLAGWGIREGSMVFFGGLIGLAKPEALAVSLLYGLVLILTSIPGLYFYMIKKPTFGVAQ